MEANIATARSAIALLREQGRPTTGLFGVAVPCLHRGRLVDTSELLAGLGVREPHCNMRLQSLGGAEKIALHISFGTVDVVSEYVLPRPISLRLGSHSFLRL